MAIEISPTADVLSKLASGVLSDSARAERAKPIPLEQLQMGDKIKSNDGHDNYIFIGLESDPTETYCIWCAHIDRHGKILGNAVFTEDGAISKTSGNESDGSLDWSSHTPVNNPNEEKTPELLKCLCGKDPSQHTFNCIDDLLTNSKIVRRAIVCCQLCAIGTQEGSQEKAIKLWNNFMKKNSQETKKRKFDHTKAAKTIGGLKVRLLCANLKNEDYPLVYAITENDGTETALTYTLEGLIRVKAHEDDEDNLINIEP